MDVRGALGVGGFFASAASMETADTPLLRAARNCDPRATMASTPARRESAFTRCPRPTSIRPGAQVPGPERVWGREGIDRPLRQTCIDFEDETTPHDDVSIRYTACYCCGVVVVSHAAGPEPVRPASFLPSSTPSSEQISVVSRRWRAGGVEVHAVHARTRAPARVV